MWRAGWDLFGYLRKEALSRSLLQWHAGDPVTLSCLLNAVVARDARSTTEIPRFPLIDQIRLPDERTAHGDIIACTFLRQLFGHIIGPYPSHKKQRDLDFLLNAPCFLLEIGLNLP